MLSTDVNLNERNEDTSTIPGYIGFHKFRHTNASRASGGLALFVKESFSKRVHILPNENERWELIEGKCSSSTCILSLRKNRIKYFLCSHYFLIRRLEL